MKNGRQGPYVLILLIEGSVIIGGLKFLNWFLGLFV